MLRLLTKQKITDSAVNARRLNESVIAENEKYLRQAQLLVKKKSHLLKILDLENKIADKTEQQNLHNQQYTLLLKKKKTGLVKEVKRKQEESLALINKMEGLRGREKRFMDILDIDDKGIDIQKDTSRSKGYSRAATPDKNREHPQEL